MAPPNAPSRPAPNTDNTSGNLKLSFAQFFYENNISIIPIEPATKKPVIKNWQKYAEAPLTKAEFDAFFEQIKSGLNYAVVAGKNLVILDFEDKEVAKRVLDVDSLCKDTLCVDTPHGGLHVYLLADDAPPHKFNPFLVRVKEDGSEEGVADLQTGKAYAVGPGSCINHKFCDSDKCKWKGKDYVTCYQPNGVMKIAKVKLTDLLKDVMERAKEQGLKFSKNAEEWLATLNGWEDVFEDETLSDDFEKFVKALKKYDKYKGMKPGHVRKAVCEEISERLKSATSEDAKFALNLAHQAVCEKKNYKDIGIDRSRGDFNTILVLMSLGVTDPDMIKELLPEDSKVFAPKWDKYFEHTLRKVWQKVRPFVTLTQQAKTLDKSELKAEVASRLSELVIKKYRIRTFYQRDYHSEYIVGTFAFSKKRGFYVPIEKSLRKIIRKEAELMGELVMGKKLSKVVKVSKRIVDEVFDEVRDKTLKRYPEMKKPRIAFKNVTIEWGDTTVDVVYERDEKKFAFNYIDHNIKIKDLVEFASYVKGREISLQDVEDFFRRVAPKTYEVFRAWANEKWITLLELIGYTLYPDIIFRKAFMLLGPGGNGKSTFVNLLVKLLGENNVENIDVLSLFGQNSRFMASRLFHKLVNATSETKEYSIEDIDKFKRITGGDRITADVKYKDPITFKPYAKLVIASNKLPKVDDTTDTAFWRRWLIIEFPNKFDDNNAWMRDVFTEDEMEGTLTAAIVAFVRVLQQGRFDFEQSEKEIMDMWLTNTDPVYRFIVEKTKDGTLLLNPRDENLFIKKDDLLRMFVDWASDAGVTEYVDKKELTAKLQAYFGIKTGQKKVVEDGEEKRVRVYIGIGVNPKKPEKKEESVTPVTDEFLEYVKKNKGIREYHQIVMDFGSTEKAHQFIDWCLKKGLCAQRGLDAVEIDPG
jgi:putative DNA primase/helicase